MIEELIYKTLQAIPYLSENISQYNNQPAVFYQQLPHGKNTQWQNQQMFPRVIYNVNWRYNPERKTDGSMLVDIFCNNESDVMPEQLAGSLVSNLSELFLTDKSGTYCLLWDRTDSFDMEGTEPLVCGVTIAFDIVTYPKQEGLSPCPVWSVNQLIKARHEKAVLIGHDKLTEVLRATKECPVIYVRKINTKNIRTSYAMAWMQTDINISVISDSIENTREWVNDMIQYLAVEQETTMQNGSPYLLMDISETTTNEPVKTGQIVLSGQYGIMRNIGEGVRLHNVHFKKE